MLFIKRMIAVRKARRFIRQGHSTKAAATLIRVFGPDRTPYVMADISFEWPIGTSFKHVRGKIL